MLTRNRLHILSAGREQQCIINKEKINMEMTYDGALVMPSSFVAMNDEEMVYVNGGGTLTLGVTIKNNSFIIGLLSAVGGTLTVAKATAVLSAATGAIITAIELGTAGAATLYAGAMILALGSIIPAMASFAVTYGINSLKGKTFKKSVTCKWLPSKTFCPKI